MRHHALAVLIAAAVACAPAATTTTTMPVAVTPDAVAPDAVAPVAVAPVGTTPVLLPPGVKWVAGPPSLPAGARAAVIDGDPSREGLFTMRLWMPDNFIIPPHTHPAFEHITIISGVLHIGMGNTVSMARATELRQGAFNVVAPGMAHFVHAAGETVVQLHGMGPWSLKYVNAADDPRNR